MVTKKADTKELKITQTPIPLEWHVPDGVITPLAFNMVVQVVEDMFKVSFFEVKPPVIIDKSTPPPSSIRAECVASVFISPNKLPRFIKVLQNHYDSYTSAQQV